MAGADTVVLLHGLWLNALAMRLMQRRLERGGYVVHAYSYPTMRLTLSENAERLGHYCNESGASRLHFVAHSMGGLVALKAAALVPPPCRGRIVLMGTPYADSFSARRLQRLPGGRPLLGRCMAQWLIAGRAACPELVEGLDGYDIGVIAGNGGIGLGRLIAPRLPKPNDGVISVNETHIPGMRDYVVLEVSHSEMLVSREVVRQACAFLKHGSFDKRDFRRGVKLRT